METWRAKSSRGQIQKIRSYLRWKPTVSFKEGEIYDEKIYNIGVMLHCGLKKKLIKQPKFGLIH